LFLKIKLQIQEKTLKSLNIKLSRDELHLKSSTLLKLVMKQYFGDVSGFVNTVVEHAPSPLTGASLKVQRLVLVLYPLLSFPDNEQHNTPFPPFQ
jgi:hypothetical protein